MRQTLRHAINHGIAKPVVFALCLLPLAALALAGPDGWGANPPEYFNRFLGDWGLRMILVTLAITPLAKITRVAAFMRFRRMVGLFAFFYAFLHLASYVVFDQFFDLAAIWDDVIKRTYITVGMAAFIGLLPLVLTSTKKAMRRMGGKAWQKLHKLIYAIAIGAVVHNIMMVKANYDEAIIHALILAVLLGWRVSQRRPAKTPQASSAAGI